MSIIKTKSFELATYAQGDKDSSRVAIVIPGRLDTKDYVSMRSLVDYLSTKGYYALSFDPPGTWESPGTIELFTTTNYINAVNEVIEYLGSRPTILLGHSRGGSVSMLAGATNTHVIGIVVMMASYGQPTPPNPELVESGIMHDTRDTPPGTSRTKERKEFDLPLSYFEDALKYNPGTALEDCTKPKLLFYGKQDEFTKPERVMEVFTSLPEPKMLYELNSDHDYRLYSEVVIEVNQVVGKFLNTYNLV